MEKKIVPWWWMRDSNGKPSMSATFASVAFFTTTAIYIASVFEKIGSVSIRPFDIGACSSYFVPTLALYFGRKFTSAKYPESKNNDSAKE